ncbi:HlyC/CorC family transporter [Stomatobaculum longum]|uniref:HlyC/CorC family transporter n=1 Tax=Stomatobaculum longum TaxID=796942 RepID=UPI00280A872C|nr:hemolysin family protein [Stomatobaculum longum]
MSHQDLVELCMLIALLVLSALFSSSETALTTVNRIRIRTLAGQGDKRAMTLLAVLQNPEKMLSVILIGNNVVNLYASSLATTVTLSLFGSKLVGVATGILTLAVLVFGEVAPKTMASRNAEQIALRAAGPVKCLMWLFTPLVFVVNNLARLVMKLFGADRPGKRELMTAEELRTIVQVGHEEGVIENSERKMIDNVFDFGDRSARDIMIPRIDMTCIDVEAGYDELMEVVREEKYTRIPVYKESADTIVGILNIKDLLFRAQDKPFRIAELMRKPLFTYEQKKTSELMVEMRKNYTNLAIVLDEYGVTAGMVTMEDILEEIVGEIRDEYDRDEEKSIRRIAPNTYLIEGNVKIDDVNEVLQLHLASEDYESIGGYVLEQLEHFPKEGECVTKGGISFTVTRMEQTRIAEVKLSLAPEKSVVK